MPYNLITGLGIRMLTSLEGHYSTYYNLRSHSVYLQLPSTSSEANSETYIIFQGVGPPQRTLHTLTFFFYFFMLLPPPTMSVANLFYLENTSFKNQVHSWPPQTAIQSVPYTKASGKAEVWTLKLSPLSAPQARPEAATTKRKGSMPRGNTFLSIIGPKWALHRKTEPFP